MRPAKFLSRPILFKSGWNWNLKFGFLGQHGQKTIFQIRWTKNTDEPKIYLVWFSSTVWRGHIPLKFFAENTEHFCTFEQFCVVSGFVSVALIYLFFIIKSEPLVVETLIEIESTVAKHIKRAILFLSKYSASDNFLTPSKRYLKTHCEFSSGININFIYSNSPLIVNTEDI